MSIQKRLGILVGGGPAPGINSAISSCTIEAINSGLDVVGICDGFERLMAGDTSMVRPLAISDVSRIHTHGGSILRTSRANPARQPDGLQRCVDTLRAVGVSHLVTIGGDDTAFSAFEVVKAAKGAFRVAHVPKTIDNDLPLPGNMATFGHETARHVGTKLVLNLMEDSRTTNRWYFVVAMGRKAGHLALGIGKAAGATVTVIPEEFPKARISLEDVCRVLEGSMVKRSAMGNEHGLAVVAEGVAEKIDPEELAKLPNVEVRYDTHGNIRLAEIPLATIISRQVEGWFAERGITRKIVDVTIGFELRSAPPIPFDIDYTRTLGYGAVRFLLSDPPDERLSYGGLVCIDQGHLQVLPFEELRDATTGRSRIRVVDTGSQHYEVARKYMIRLSRDDMRDPEMRTRLARAASADGAGIEEGLAAVNALIAD